MIVKRPIDIPAILKMVAVLLLLLVVGYALISTQDDKRVLQSQLDADRAVSSCRSRLSAAVTDAGVDHDLAFSQLLIDISRPDRQSKVPSDIASLASTDSRLSAARDERVAFEERVLGLEPGEHLTMTCEL